MFRAARIIGIILPLPTAMALLYPLAWLRGTFEVVARRSAATPRSLPPARPSAPFGVALHERTSAWMSTAALLWADRFARSPWSGRIDVSQIDELRALAASRPVLVATVHYGGIFVMPTLLRAHGIPTAAVVGDKLWPVRWWRERRASLTRIGDLPAHLRSGDARSMIRYLVPGHCLLVALDYPIGTELTMPYQGSSMRLYTSSFRLARMAGAAIVPVILRVDGTWRYSLHVGAPVPDTLLAGDDDAAVLAHIVTELMTVARQTPEQALPLLVKSFEAPAGA
jgi:lauroyl/myristoyl acyltransferase